MKKNTKTILFERMKYLNPDFKLINENVELDERHVDVSNLPDITTKIPIPNIGTKVYKDIEIEGEGIRVKDNDFKPHKRYDFVVSNDGTLNIGFGHLKLAGNMTKTIKAAGEIMLDDNGKIVYLSNESGHFQPTEEDLNAIADKFKEMNLINREYFVKHKKH